MKNEELIAVTQLCTHYQIEFSFVNSLAELGLIETILVEQTPYLSHNQIRDLEKLIRLHEELEINLEGIDVIYHLLKKVDQQQVELNALRNRLRLYEDE